jgi:energy-coupling factor transporter ATP-binding protein EcfA2
MIGRWFRRSRTELPPAAPPEVTMPKQETVAPPVPPPNPLRRPDPPRTNPAVVPGGPAFARQKAAVDADDALSQPSLVRSPFTPTQPVQTGASLIGRRAQIERAIAAVEGERAHVAIFGERGHGKTSLANIVAGLAEDAGYGVVRHACSAGGSFSDLIGGLLEKIPPRFLRRASADGAETAAPDHHAEWTVATATAALERIRFGQVLIFVDEFDRLVAPNARRDMAELLKNCSDLGLRASFVLIGVAESLGELLALHQSIHRNLVAIPMPLLTDADLSLLLTQGCERLGMRLEWEAEKLLLQLSHQSPFTAQQLGLHATASAQRRRASVVTAADVSAAARLVLEETRPVFAPLIDPLPLERRSPDGTIWDDLLYEAARAPCDGFGWFTAKDVNLPKCEDDLRTLTRPDSGPLLRVRRVAGRVEFVFARANLRNYLLLRGAERNGVI